MRIEIACFSGNSSRSSMNSSLRFEVLTAAGGVAHDIPEHDHAERYAEQPRDDITHVQPPGADSRALTETISKKNATPRALVTDLTKADFVREDAEDDRRAGSRSCPEGTTGV